MIQDMVLQGMDKGPTKCNQCKTASSAFSTAVRAAYYMNIKDQHENFHFGTLTVHYEENE